MRLGRACPEASAMAGGLIVAAADCSDESVASVAADLKNRGVRDILFH